MTLMRVIKINRYHLCSTMIDVSMFNTAQWKERVNGSPVRLPQVENNRLTLSGLSQSNWVIKECLSR